MADDALLLTEADLRPLTREAPAIDGAIDAIRQVTLALHRGEVTQATFLGHAPGGRPSTRITLATGASLPTGARLFGTPAPDYLGLVRAVNTRTYLLLDGVTGQVLALMDYGQLNPVRVGAVGGLAARHLAPPGAHTLAVLGSGQQARTQMQGVCRALGEIRRARVYSPTPAHREAFAREMSAWLGVPTEAVASVDAATRDAEVIAVANSSRAPVLDAHQVQPGALVIAVTDGQLGPALIDGSRLVLITWEAFTENLTRWEPYMSRIAAGDFTRAELAAELTAVVAGEAQPRRSAEEIVTFALNALPVHDLAVAHWAYSWARAHGVGTPFVLSTS